MASTPAAAERLDKWLWTVRIFKMRTHAAEACRGGLVEIAGHPAKPSRDLRAGDTLLVRQGPVTRTLVVLGFPGRRVGAGLVAGFCEDRTPPEEYAKARVEPRRDVLPRAKGLGRPTKRDRREIDRLFQ